jgi:hypothetical protein
MIWTDLSILQSASHPRHLIATFNNGRVGMIATASQSNPSALVAAAQVTPNLRNVSAATRLSIS